MTPDQLIELKSNPDFRAHLVKFVALHCFRNTKLEALPRGQIATVKDWRLLRR